MANNDPGLIPSRQGQNMGSLDNTRKPTVPSGTGYGMGFHTIKSYAVPKGTANS